MSAHVQERGLRLACSYVLLEARVAGILRGGGASQCLYTLYSTWYVDRVQETKNMTLCDLFHVDTTPPTFTHSTYHSHCLLGIVSVGEEVPASS